MKRLCPGRKIERTDKPEADLAGLTRFDHRECLKRRNGNDLCRGSTRLGHRDPGGPTCNRQAEFLPPDHFNGVRFLLPSRIGTPIILARPRTAVTVRLSLSAISMMLFPAPAICRSCAPSSSFHGRRLTRIISPLEVSFGSRTQNINEPWWLVSSKCRRVATRK
jgi:hypothetical protein